VPLITVRVADDRRTLQLSQARYRPIGSRIPAGGQWNVPFCATVYADNRAASRVCTMITGTEAQLMLPDDGRVAAVMPNAGGLGYYRFALDPSDLDALIARAGSLAPGEALALGDSVLAGFRAGTVTFDRLLTAAERLAAHPDHDAATRLGMNLVSLAGSILEPSERAPFARRLADIYRPRLKSVGLNRRAERSKEPPDTALLRAALLRIVAIGARDPEARRAVKGIAAPVSTDAGAVDIGLRDVAWIVAAQDEPRVQKDALAAIMLTGPDPLARQHAAEALGAIDDPQVSAEVRAMALDERMGPLELYYLLTGQFSNPLTRDSSWSWLASNMQTLLKRLPGFSRGRLFELPGSLCDATRRAEVETRLTPTTREIGSGELELARALESIELCAAQKDAHRSGIALALKQ
jgi:hypothetical protein